MASVADAMLGVLSAVGQLAPLQVCLQILLLKVEVVSKVLTIINFEK